jgi:LacI family transcriptional regulator
MKRLTLDDIGKMAGVSRATVSRVVNGYPHIRTDVRERVEQVIASTGFRLNAVARSLASNRSHMIGLIVPCVVEELFNDPYFPVLINGVTQEGGKRRQIVSLYLISAQDTEEDMADSIIRAGFLDGVVLALGQYRLGKLASLGLMPLVAIGQPRDVDTVPYVDVDNQLGGYLATQHLLNLGHRRIGIIAVSAHASGERRLLGYQRALADYGVALDERLIVQADFSERSGSQAMEQLLEQNPSPLTPTAVFASSDRMALGALNLLKARGWHVPEQIALVGFDDLLPSLIAQPMLTTVRQPVEALGIEAVRLLCNLINDPTHQHPNTRLTVELVIRDSCGAKRLNP